MESRQFTIGRMDCPGCAREVETALADLEGVRSARVDYFANTLHLVGDVDFDRLRGRVETVGKSISMVDALDSSTGDEVKRAGALGFWNYLLGRSDSRLALGGGALLLAAIALDLTRLLPSNATNLVYILAMLVAMKPIALSGYNALRINRLFNINMLMTIAAVGALILGEYLEAATVIFLFAIGEALEGYTADRARDSLRALIALKPSTAQRIVGDAVLVVPVEALTIGDRIRVLPGERIPMDGAVLAGISAVDQAHITGESLPVTKGAGTEVFAGSINGEATLDIEVTRLSADNTLSRIIELLRSAQSRRAPSQRLIDRFAHIYTPAVALTALAVALVPPLVFGGSFWDTSAGHGWLYRALAMLVIACPCALVISTPVTVISAITAAARRGVLIKGGAALEALAGAKIIAFDKTGTLTRGQIEVAATYTDDCAEGPDCEPCAELLALAASVEAQSTHPFAAAILRTATEQGLDYAGASAVETMAGRGMRGDVAGKRVTIGSHRFFDNEFDHTDHLCDLAARIEENGQSAVMVHDGAGVRGVIALADAPREESRAVVDSLGNMAIQSVMLSGDNSSVAASIAEQVGVDHYYGDLLPQDKVIAIEKLLTKHGQVAMVGDGINDSPALARASVGIAMGGAGSAQAMETADVVLLADGLGQLPVTIRRSRFARRLIRQNIALSFGLKALFLLLAVTGNVTMLVAVFADMGMSLAVTLNGMRALRE
ncbi:MAG: cation-translocating P-type ATPase [Chloroflexi bacterium]|nr:cation-translocating P-type ATPase [Chloroflexota bacterium]